VALPTSLRQLVETISMVKPRVLNLEHGAGLLDVLLCADEQRASRYVRMRRVHICDGDPYCLIDLVLDVDIYRKAPARFRKYPVIPVMDQLGALRSVAARQQLTIRSADLDEAEHLLIEAGAPVADVRRTIIDASGTAVYAAIVLYPSRTVRLDMNLVAP
jgi:GntR family transcriptional regulator